MTVKSITRVVATLGQYEYEEDFYDAQSFMVETLEDALDFPVALSAVNSNWRGQTGIAEASSGAETLDKVYSFGPEEGFELKHDSKDGYYFRLSSHDVPTGFNIYIEEIESE